MLDFGHGEKVDCQGFGGAASVCDAPLAGMVVVI
jgi:hypothetical protein